MALIFSAYAAGCVSSASRSGAASPTRIGRKPILISTVCGNCLCYVALAFAPNIYVAFVVRLIGGMASGNASVIQGYIADVTPADQRTGRMSMLGAAYNLGFIVGPALGGLAGEPVRGTCGLPASADRGGRLAGLCVLGIVLFVKESRSHRTTISRMRRAGRLPGAPSPIRSSPG